MDTKRYEQQNVSLPIMRRLILLKNGLKRQKKSDDEVRFPS